MYGETAIEMMRELKRCAPSFVPPYNAEGMRKVISEMNELYNEVRRTIDLGPEAIRQPEVAGSIVVHHAAIDRNKRCMLTYLLSKLQALRWEAGAIIPDEWRQNISENEARYFGEYGKLLNVYMKGYRIDLTADLRPPKELFVEVRVLKDFGEFTLESGESVMLTVGTQRQHLLRRTDVEPLIRQGYLQHVV